MISTRRGGSKHNVLNSPKVEIGLSCYLNAEGLRLVVVVLAFMGPMPKWYSRCVQPRVLENSHHEHRKTRQESVASRRNKALFRLK